MKWRISRAAPMDWILARGGREYRMYSWNGCIVAFEAIRKSGLLEVEI